MAEKPDIGRPHVRVVLHSGSETDEDPPNAPRCTRRSPRYLTCARKYVFAETPELRPKCCRLAAGLRGVHQCKRRPSNNLAGVAGLIGSGGPLRSTPATRPSSCPNHDLDQLKGGGRSWIIPRACGVPCCSPLLRAWQDLYQPWLRCSPISFNSFTNRSRSYSDPFK